MAKYQVIRAWHGVSVGQVVELKELHPALKANVIEVGKGVGQTENADDVLAKAKAEAQTIIDDAKAEAERIKTEAQKQVGELTPATPEATSKTAKTK